MTDICLDSPTRTRGSTTPPPFGEITLARGVGRGPTTLAAFDTALLDAGVANYNLICLSSVIPPGSRIVRRRWRTPAHEYGRRLYVVMSHMREDRPGREVHAGVAWVRDADAGHGLFVELHDRERARLEHDLHATLMTMQRNRGLQLGPVQAEIASARCDGEPVCALVIAVYGSTPW